MRHFNHNFSGVFVIPLLCLMLILAACNLGGPNAGGGNLGVTPGGVQDMALARELVSNGRVPPASAFSVEGIFSEYDLPLTGAVCEQLFCIRSALAIAPDAEGKDAGWLQLSYSSNLQAESFKLEPMSIIFVVDVSGSMNWRYQSNNNEYQSPLGVAKEMMQQMTQRMREVDEVAIVTYGSQARVYQSFTSDKTLLQRRIRALRTEGTTNMEAGLQSAYRLASQARNGQKRLMLFTDVQPNVGATTPTEFERLVQEGASSGTGMTVFGVGVGMGATLFKAMSQIRGGNAFSIFSSQDTDNFMKDNWPFFLQAVAYDFKVEIASSNAGSALVQGYGFPVSDGAATLNTSTLFLSKRRGAQLLQFSLDDEAARRNFAVQSSLSYENLAGKRENQTLNTQLANPNATTPYFQQRSLQKSIALALAVSNMHKAAQLYAVNREAATSLMSQTYQRFLADSQALDDNSLQRDVEFSARLLELMQQGAPQGNFYGQ